MSQDSASASKIMLVISSAAYDDDLCFRVCLTPGFTHEVPEVEYYACFNNSESSSTLSGAAISKPRRVIAERAQLPERPHA
jgi:hypothetical protein